MTNNRHMNNKRSENSQTIILEMFKEIQRIGKHFVERVREPRPFPETPPSLRGPHELHETPIHGQVHRPWTFLDRRPFIFPELSRLTSLYLGWTFTKGRPDNNTMSTQPAWRWAICTQMALSTEELFLKVLNHTNRRSKLRRSIQDDLKELLRSSVQRMLVDDLIRGQNMSLSLQYPFLKLKLAGLACKKRKIDWFNDELKSVDVILKTEWAVGSPPHGLADDGGGMGPPPHPPPPPPGPGFDDSTYGPGSPLGPGGGGGSSGSGYPPSRGDSGPFYHSSQGPESPQGGKPNLLARQHLPRHTLAQGHQNPHPKYPRTSHGGTLSGRNQKAKPQPQTAMPLSGINEDTRRCTLKLVVRQAHMLRFTISQTLHLLRHPVHIPRRCQLSQGK